MEMKNILFLKYLEFKKFGNTIKIIPNLQNNS